MRVEEVRVRDPFPQVLQHCSVHIWAAVSQEVRGDDPHVPVRWGGHLPVGEHVDRAARPVRLRSPSPDAEDLLDEGAKAVLATEVLEVLRQPLVPDVDGVVVLATAVDEFTGSIGPRGPLVEQEPAAQVGPSRELIDGQRWFLAVGLGHDAHGAVGALLVLLGEVDRVMDLDPAGGEATELGELGCVEGFRRGDSGQIGLDPAVARFEQANDALQLDHGLRLTGDGMKDLAERGDGLRFQVDAGAEPYRRERVEHLLLRGPGRVIAVGLGEGLVVTLRASRESQDPIHLGGELCPSVRQALASEPVEEIQEGVWVSTTVDVGVDFPRDAERPGRRLLGPVAVGARAGTGRLAPGRRGSGDGGDLQRGEVLAHARVADLEQPDRPVVEVLERVLPERAQRRRCRQSLVDGGLSGLGDEDLTAVGHTRHPRRLMHRQGDVLPPRNSASPVCRPIRTARLTSSGQHSACRANCPLTHAVTADLAPENAKKNPSPSASTS